MSQAVLNEYQFALEQIRGGYALNGADRDAAEFEGYCDAVQSGMATVYHGTKLDPEDFKISYSRILRLTSPAMIERVISGNRRQHVRTAIFGLAKAMERMKHGKPPLRFFGLFG